jgi:predicted GH43/DUF377 family glycosyl hydrolase
MKCAVIVTLLFNAGYLLAADTSLARSWELGPFLRPEHVNPVIKPDTKLRFDCPMNGQTVSWAALHTFNPGAVLKGDQVCVLYRAEDASGSMSIGGHTSRIGLAESSDGLHFTSRNEPVLFPAEDGQKSNEWTGGCEDPRVVETEDGTYVMTYSEYCRGDKLRMVHLGVATSKDLIHWTKHGPAFEELGGKSGNRYSKSGAIVTRLVNGKLVAAKHLGKYWMYWGEGEIRLASSDDLIHWARGSAVLKTRDNKFDSALVEAGPPAVITSQGIVLIYNGKNASKNGDGSLKAGAYAGGQALFDLDNPARLLERTDTPFYKPEAPFEQTGQYSAGTTFLEGLIFFHGRWLLYYGCADSYVAVAITTE